MLYFQMENVMSYMLAANNTVSFFLLLQGMYAVVEFSERDHITSLQDATGTPQFVDECPVPFKSRIFTLTLKNSTSQSSEQTPIHYHKQSPVSVGDLAKKLCDADSVSSWLLFFLIFLFAGWGGNSSLMFELNV